MLCYLFLIYLKNTFKKFKYDFFKKKLIIFLEVFNKKLLIKLLNRHLNVPKNLNYFFFIFFKKFKNYFSFIPYYKEVIAIVYFNLINPSYIFFKHTEVIKTGIVNKKYYSICKSKYYTNCNSNIVFSNKKIKWHISKLTLGLCSKIKDRCSTNFSNNLIVLKNFKINSIRVGRFFNKSKYSRCRQICINITILGLLINILFINELHRSFYNININLVFIFYILGWLILSCILIKNFLIFKK